MFKSVDVIAELAKERSLVRQGEGSVMQQVSAIWKQDAELDANIRQRLTGNQEETSTWTLDQLGRLDSELIFDRTVIRNICMKYRLRFLNSQLFAGEVPYEATVKIKEAEEQIGVTFQGFYILAPESRFKLKDSTEDPILFANLGNGEYYMIHKWGDDMGWYRHVLSFPVRNISTLALTSVIFGLLATMLMPDSLFPTPLWESSFAMGITKVYFSFVVSAFFFVAALIFGIMRSKEFSQDNWNSKYFN